MVSSMFPESGVPWQDARNSLEDPTTNHCDELWYSTTRCQPRFDPAAANAVLAELINIINGSECTYNCQFNRNLELSIKWLIQRGKCCGGIARYGPFDYFVDLDPPLTTPLGAGSPYNDFLTLIIIPEQDNQGKVRLNCSTRGWVSLLRNDGKELEAKDLLKGKPALVSFYQGYFYMVGLCSSQVPIVVRGAVDIWIRTDGNDDTGDGSENKPEKAFRTIAGAWQKVGNRYASTPLFVMRFRLGIPGTYQGAWIGGFGGLTELYGDINNRSGYRIAGFDHGSNIWSAFTIGSLNMWYYGLTFLRDGPASYGVDGFRCHTNGSALFNNCDWESVTGATQGSMILNAGGEYGFRPGVINFHGHGMGCGNIFHTLNAGMGGGTGSYGTCIFNFNQIVLSGAAFRMQRLGITAHGSPQDVFVDNGVTGRKYDISENSILTMGNVIPPGTQAGSASSGAQYVP